MSEEELSPKKREFIEANAQLMQKCEQLGVTISPLDFFNARFDALMVHLFPDEESRGDFEISVIKLIHQNIIDNEAAIISQQDQIKADMAKAKLLQGMPPGTRLKGL